MTTAFLTIDDAPSTTLPAKVDALSDADVPALFFCEGGRLEDHAENARTAIEAGYHLGNHAYSHTYASELSVEAFREETAGTEERIDAVYNAAGVSRPAKLFRFPYGDRGDNHGDVDDADIRAAGVGADSAADLVAGHQAVLEEFGFDPIDSEPLGPDASDSWATAGRDWGWTVDTKDWAVEDSDELRERLAAVQDQLTDPGGEVVLFHDDGTDVDSLETLIAFCRDRGVAFGDPLELVAR